jgi:hypothetical protein
MLYMGLPCCGSHAYLLFSSMKGFTIR